MADRTEVRLTGMDGVLRLLQQLPAEVVSKRGGPVKAALRKGALVILAAEQANLQRVTSNATESEKQESTGLLLKNLIVSRGKPPNAGKGERYLVRVRRKTYVRKGGKPVTTLKTAQILEYGSEKQQAEPWIRPAFKATARQAIDTVTAELLKRLDKVVKRLAAANKGK